MTSATTMLEEPTGVAQPALNSWPAIIGVAIPTMMWGFSKMRAMWSRDAVDKASADGQGDVIATLRTQLAAETARADNAVAARDAAIEQIGKLRLEVQDLALQVQALTAQVQSFRGQTP